jgi:hypothetical protein
MPGKENSVVCDDLRISRSLEFAYVQRKRIGMNRQSTQCAEERAMVKLSIWDDSQREIDTYKWIVSEHAGYDLGETAVRRWIKEHWSGYLRARWIEHLQGKRFWIELDRDDFGLLTGKFQDQTLLLDRIVDRLIAGGENLLILLWAQDCHIPMENVLQILEALDINSKRLSYRFNS